MADVVNLYPEFAQRLDAFRGLLRDKYGLETDIGSGRRDNSTQARLYAQGRTAPGPIVTNAPPGSSYHNYGAAVDLVPKGMKEADAEKVMRQAFQENPDTGLSWGGNFKSLYDPFHVQTGVPLNALRGDPQAGAQGPSGPGQSIPASGAAAASSPSAAPPGSAAPDRVSPGVGMLSGADLSGGNGQGGPDLGQLAQRALALSQIGKPAPVQPLQPIQMPVPAGLRARLQAAALGQG